MCTPIFILRRKLIIGLRWTEEWDYVYIRQSGMGPRSRSLKFELRRKDFNSDTVIILSNTKILVHNLKIFREKYPDRAGVTDWNCISRLVHVPSVLTVLFLFVHWFKTYSTTNSFSASCLVNPPSASTSDIVVPLSPLLVEAVPAAHPRHMSEIYSPSLVGVGASLNCESYFIRSDK